MSNTWKKKKEEIKKHASSGWSTMASNYGSNSQILNNTRIKLQQSGKNGFAEVFKNLATYRFDNNFVWTIKIIM